MWRIQLLGGFAAHGSQRKVTRFRTQKAAALLAYLAFHSSAQPRETLIGMLWPDAEPDAGRHNLSNALSFLRHLLEPQGVPPGSVILADRFSVQLNPAAVSTDVGAFERAVKAAIQPELSDERRLELLAEASKEYSGVLLPGFYDDWISPEALRLESLFARSMTQLSTELLRSREFEQASKIAQRVLRVDPTNEECIATLIRSLSSSGQHAQALRAYRSFEKRLDEDFGLEPSKALKALVQQLGQSRETPLGAEPEATCQIDEQRLTASVAPTVQTRQSDMRDRGTDRGVTRGKLLGGEFLLRTASRFFDREEEVETLSRMLTAPRTRLVTLTGPGGTGKTRLAIEAAAHLVSAEVTEHRHPDTAVFVSLSEITDASRLFDVILRAMGGVPSAGLDPLDQLAQALESQPDTLLILDNFEQLVGDGALQVQEVLSKAAHVKILVTTRIKLGLGGEREFHLSALPTSAGASTPEDLLRVPSVAMFVDRAQSALADFQLTPRNVEAVCQLCDYLEGLPLSIELAAARVAVLSPARILQQVQHSRLDFLTAQRKDRASRQRTLRTTLEWSYLLLPEVGRAFLRQVSVFRGGWSFDAAKAVCSQEEAETLDLLTLLRDSSLIGVADTEDGLRFSLLETIREYAGEQLALSHEAEEIGQRHASYFAKFSEVAEGHLFGPDQAIWLDRLETEHENLLAALAWYKTDRLAAGAGLRLAGTLGRFWQIHAHYGDGRARLGEALSGTPERNSARAKALASAGVLALDQADHASARKLLNESLTIYEELADRPGTAQVLSFLGNLSRDEGQETEAGSFYQQSLEAFQELGDRRGIAVSLHGLGVASLQKSSYDSARQSLEESLAISRSLGDKQEIAWLLFQLGNLAREQSEFGKAKKLQEESFTVFRELRDTNGMSKALYSLGFVSREESEFEEAHRFLEQCLSLCRELGDKRGIAVTLHQLGLLAAKQGRCVDAKRHFEEGVPLLREVGDYAGIGWSMIEQARLSTAAGDYETAEECYRESLAAWHEVGQRIGCADTWGRIGWPSYAKWKKSGSKLGSALTVLELGRLACERGLLSEAKTYCLDCCEIFRDIGNPVGVASSLFQLGKVVEAQGLLSDAAAFYSESFDIWKKLNDKEKMQAARAGLTSVTDRLNRIDR